MPQTNGDGDREEYDREEWHRRLARGTHGIDFRCHTDERQSHEGDHSDQPNGVRRIKLSDHVLQAVHEGTSVSMNFGGILR